MRKNFGGNIFGGKNFGDFLLGFGVIFSGSPQNLEKFGEKSLVEKFWWVSNQYFIEIQWF